MKLHRAQVVKMDEFKYLGSAIQSSSQVTGEVKRNVQTEWSVTEGQ